MDRTSLARALLVSSLLACGTEPAEHREGDDPVVLEWTAMAPLLGPRERHTAVEVGGEVLVVGGFGEVDASIATERWSAAEGRWSSGPPLLYARDAHTTTALADGRALIVGGCCDGMVDGEAATEATVVAWDPATATASNMAPLLRARDGHSATLLPDGRVLVVGGERFTSLDARYKLDSVEIYAPSTNTWTALLPLSVKRDAHTATLLPDGRVLIIAGDWYAGVIGELWDPATERWTPIADNGRPRVEHTTTLLQDGRVLVVGGQWNTPLGGMTNVDIYDPATDQWTEASPLARGRMRHTSTLLADGRVIVAGGCCDGEPGQSLQSTEVYDVATNLWSPGPPMSVRRENHSALVLKSGAIMMIGGGDGATKRTTGITQRLD